MLDSDTDQVLRAALRAEYDLSYEALRPGGVEAVRAAAVREHRRRAVGAAGLVALLLLGGVAGWWIAGSAPPAQTAAPRSCDGPGTDVSVFLKQGTTDEQRAEVRTVLESSAEVYCLRFEDQVTAWRNFQREFSDAPDLVGATKPENLPESFRFRVAGRAGADTVERLVAPLGGVSDVVCSCRLLPS
ncbi:permease-like cell division protein FtsX [Dactylosporangium sp. NPDC000244]|uniref:permease-like cell division protein FtsX n=1 Tax=Dactylosporangium sp. NPDC000244 TaxID=3154365 RepID=UPI0033296EF2